MMLGMRQAESILMSGELQEWHVGVLIVMLLSSPDNLVVLQPDIPSFQTFMQALS